MFPEVSSLQAQCKSEVDRVLRLNAFVWLQELFSQELPAIDLECLLQNAWILGRVADKVNALRNSTPARLSEEDLLSQLGDRPYRDMLADLQSFYQLFDDLCLQRDNMFSQTDLATGRATLAVCRSFRDLSLALQKLGVEGVPEFEIRDLRRSTSMTRRNSQKAAKFESRRSASHSPTRRASIDGPTPKTRCLADDGGGVSFQFQSNLRQSWDGVQMHLSAKQTEYRGSCLQGSNEQLSVAVPWRISVGPSDGSLNSGESARDLDDKNALEAAGSCSAEASGGDADIDAALVQPIMALSPLKASPGSSGRPASDTESSPGKHRLTPRRLSTLALRNPAFSPADIAAHPATDADPEAASSLEEACTPVSAAGSGSWKLAPLQLRLSPPSTSRPASPEGGFLHGLVSQEEKPTHTQIINTILYSAPLLCSPSPQQPQHSRKEEQREQLADAPREASTRLGDVVAATPRSEAEGEDRANAGRGQQRPWWKLAMWRVLLAGILLSGGAAVGAQLAKRRMGAGKCRQAGWGRGHHATAVPAFKAAPSRSRHMTRSWDSPMTLGHSLQQVESQGFGQ